MLLHYLLSLNFKCLYVLNFGSIISTNKEIKKKKKDENNK